MLLFHLLWPHKSKPQNWQPDLGLKIKPPFFSSLFFVKDFKFYTIVAEVECVERH